MPNVVTDIITSPVKVYVGDIGSTAPANTVAYGAAWPAGWTDLGFTKEPLKANYEFEALDVMVRQHLGPVSRRRKTEKFSFETVLAELTADNLAIAFGGGTVTQTAAGAGVPGSEDFEFGDDPELSEKMWGFEGYYKDEAGDEYPVRLIIFRGTIQELGELLAIDKDDYTGTPLKVGALVDTSKTRGKRLFKFTKVLEPASS